MKGAVEVVVVIDQQLAYPLQSPFSSILLEIAHPVGVPFVDVNIVDTQIEPTRKLVGTILGILSADHQGNHGESEQKDEKCPRKRRVHVDEDAGCE
jgi:hypothetical protein